MLLLNGCSFAYRWTPSQNFLETVDCPKTINISLNGGSFQRTLRSSIEYCATFGKPKFAVIPFTWASRWELALAKEDVLIDGTWASMQHPEYIDFDTLDKSIPKDKIIQLVENYYGILPNVRSTWDKMFTEIISLASFFEAQGIKYLMFDMCNNFDQKHLLGYKGFEKLDLINNNKNIINIFEFCGNKYMYDLLPAEKQEKTNPYMHHHHSTEYMAMEKYLIDYLNRKL
jgi:hypothetical protein